MDTLPDIKVSNGSTPEVIKPNISKYKFGDGYTQRVANGLNSINNNFDAKWNYLTAADKSILSDFFISKNGVESFYFTIPRDIVKRKYICDEWQFVPHTGNWFSGTATFTEVFDI